MLWNIDMVNGEFSFDMPKAYNSKNTEQRVYDFWMDGGYFSPKIDESKSPFVIIMPPPNVTGELHMGHALTVALEDLMVRWHRMIGDPTLYLPGTDHAGIATQVVVERMLAEDGLNRHDMGRDNFVKAIWDWVDKYGNRIYEQTKRLGASCDWDRKSFTLDEGPSRAVRTTFVNLYKKGLIYRGERIGNWCPRCNTALSDLEVKHREENTNFYYLRYPIEKSNSSVLIATTRPETMLADTAVAVNPEDDRFRHLIGKRVVLPIVGRLLPIIGDDVVDIDFGTGALKVTPAHDHVDFEIGQRHNLEIINILNLDGTMNENAHEYQGIDRIDVRKKIVEELDDIGVLEKVDPYHHSVGHCDRCDEIVEPIIGKQWYVNMKLLAAPAIKAVEEGSIKVIPGRFSKIYFNWMHNIKDWVISRQLWWGHRIPVWYCEDCDGITVDYEDPTTCDVCKSKNIVRESDVLDTWFSSALWPHSTLGWPDNTDDLAYFYPTTVMETGYDILFFWVARMIMMGKENMGDIPFKSVYLHGLILDPDGVKMSKTRGNVLNPLELVDNYGADAVRFALTTGNSPGKDMRINEQKLEASRNFANKLWNASRFVIAKLPESSNLDSWYKPNPTHLQDRWILSRLNRVSGQVRQYMNEYQFGEAQRIIYEFLWGEYCDWYIEMAKVRMRSMENSKNCPVPILVYALERILRLLHPFMPFVTEEIWQILVSKLPVEPDMPKALIVASYPEENRIMICEKSEDKMEVITEIVRSVRNLRAEFRIQESQYLKAIVYTPGFEDLVKSESATVNFLARVELITKDIENPIDLLENHVSLVLKHGTITVLLESLVDTESEKKRLHLEVNELDIHRIRLMDRLRDKNFLNKAPELVVEQERQRLIEIDERRNRIKEIISSL